MLTRPMGEYAFGVHKLTTTILEAGIRLKSGSIAVEIMKKTPSIIEEIGHLNGEINGLKNNNSIFRREISSLTS